MKKKVAIVGSHPLTRALAPFDDKSFDIWVFNEVVGLGNVPRADAVFQMHDPIIWKNPTNRNDPKHYEWLQKEHPIPIYMLDQYPEVPSCRKYPLFGIVSMLIGQFRRQSGRQIQYFTSSVAYAIALAIYKGYKRIDLYGVEMETNTEYVYQRDGVYFWIGVALGRGIEVRICDKSGLFKSPLYGYEGDIALKVTDFEKRLEHLRPMVDEIAERVEKAKARQAAAMEQAVTALDGEKPAIIKEFFAAIKEQAGAVMDWGALDGAIYENERYLKKAGAMIDAAGGVLFSRQEFEQTAAKFQENQDHYEALVHNTGGQASTLWKMLEASVDKTDAERDEIAERYIQAHEDYLKAIYEHGRYTGIVNENMMFLHKVDVLIRMAGGRKSEEVMLEAAGVEYAK